MKKINFDHISVNPMPPQVQEAMISAIKENYGNPSSLNASGEQAAEVLENARRQVAGLINCKNVKETIFTSGGTESVNHAIKGIAFANAEKGKHIVTSNIEHSSVIRSIKRLTQLGYKATSVSVNKKGRVNPQDIKKAITDETILVSVMHGNNEIGTIQPIEEIAEITKEKKIPFHSDAVDTVGVIPVDVQKLGVDILSFASNPYCGPTGVGGLYIRRGLNVWAMFDGGIQEKNKRAGTENLIGIIGMGAAAQLATEEMNKRAEHLKSLKKLLISELPSYIDEYIINGDPENSLQNLISVSIQYIEGESILLMLEDEGYIVSTRSACATGSLRASHVLLSIGLKHEDAQGTIVITPGIENTKQDIIGFLKALKKIVNTLRDISPLYKRKE
ncbi:MAG: cysteine desulfurase [Deltaproteobacteria bacterium]|nr:cysteine desulfurase [Deltaproteobacteria bacterium]